MRAPKLKTPTKLQAIEVIGVDALVKEGDIILYKGKCDLYLNPDWIVVYDSVNKQKVQIPYVRGEFVKFKPDLFLKYEDINIRLNNAYKLLLADILINVYRDNFV